MTKEQRRQTFAWFVLGVFQSKQPDVCKMFAIRQELVALLDEKGQTLN